MLYVKLSVSFLSSLVPRPENARLVSPIFKSKCKLKRGTSRKLKLILRFKGLNLVQKNQNDVVGLCVGLS